MPDYISNNLTSIILAILALFAIGFVIRVVIKKRVDNSKHVDNSNVVNQSNNLVGGDQAGRDVIKK